MDRVTALIDSLLYKLTLRLLPQRQQAMIDEQIKAADTSRLAPGLSETDLIQELVSPATSKSSEVRLIPCVGDSVLAA